MKKEQESENDRRLDILLNDGLLALQFSNIKELLNTAVRDKDSDLTRPQYNQVIAFTKTLAWYGDPEQKAEYQSLIEKIRENTPVGTPRHNMYGAIYQYFIRCVANAANSSKPSLKKSMSMPNNPFAFLTGKKFKRGEELMAELLPEKTSPVVTP